MANSNQHLFYMSAHLINQCNFWARMGLYIIHGLHAASAHAVNAWRVLEEQHQLSANIII